MPVRENSRPLSTLVVWRKFIEAFVGKITASSPVSSAMSARTTDASLVSSPLDWFRSWLDRPRPRRASAQDEPSEDTPLEQLLVRGQWKSTSRAHPERSKVLGLIQSELSEASRLLATQKGRDCAAERELKALLLENTRIRTVDDGWELAARLKRLNLRLGRFDRAYIQGLLEYESAHAQDLGTGTPGTNTARSRSSATCSRHTPPPMS